MAIRCCIKNCFVYSTNKTFKLFSFPGVKPHLIGIARKKAELRQIRWLRAAGLTKLTAASRICSRHFINGEPACQEDDLSEDWVPSQHLIITSSPVVGSCKNQSRTSAIAAVCPNSPTQGAPPTPTFNGNKSHFGNLPHSPLMDSSCYEFDYGEQENSLHPVHSTPIVAIPQNSSVQAALPFPTGSRKKLFTSIHPTSPANSAPSLPAGSGNDSIDAVPQNSFASSFPTGSGANLIVAVPQNSSAQGAPSFPNGNCLSTFVGILQGPSAQSLPLLPLGGGNNSNVAIPQNIAAQDTTPIVAIPQNSSVQAALPFPTGSRKKLFTSIHPTSPANSAPLLPLGGGNNSNVAIPQNIAAQDTSPFSTRSGNNSFVEIPPHLPYFEHQSYNHPLVIVPPQEVFYERPEEGRTIFDEDHQIFDESLGLNVQNESVVTLFMNSSYSEIDNDEQDCSIDLVNSTPIVSVTLNSSEEVTRCYSELIKVGPANSSAIVPIPPAKVAPPFPTPSPSGSVDVLHVEPWDHNQSTVVVPSHYDMASIPATAAVLSGLSCEQNTIAVGNAVQQIFKEDKCTQTIEDTNRIEQNKNSDLEQEIQKLNRQVSSLQLALKIANESTRFSVETLSCDDNKCRFFTGLSCGKSFKHLYESLHDLLPDLNAISKEQILILTLRKIRLNESFKSLGYLYNLHPTTVSNYFYETVHSIYPLMKKYIHFPSRQILKKHMPSAFLKKYSDRITIIIDCFEVFMECPNYKKLAARANVFSFYKKHNTVKILIGISCSGSIIFISEGFGGRISDKQIVIKSGLLDYIQEDDLIMADRGFLIEEILKAHNASVTYPAFKKKNKQLEPLDAIESRELSSLRIHVERVIGVTRQKFLIFSDIIPISLLERWNDDLLALDEIIVISAALVNLCPSVVPNE